MAYRKKYKPYILKYKALISKYMPYIFRLFKHLNHKDLQKGKNEGKNMSGSVVFWSVCSRCFAMRVGVFFVCAVQGFCGDGRKTKAEIP